MKLESYGILIGMRPFGERDCVAHIFTRDYGVLCGMMRGAAVAKKNKPLVGQCGGVSWNARLDSQLGVFHWESEKNLAAPLMTNQKNLMVMNSAFALIETLLPEREVCAALYNHTESMLRQMADGADTKKIYIEWERELLTELGYALNLGRCASCGGTSNLNYLSPRTGRAVCAECAAPYLDKMYQLPLTSATTEKFLEKICQQQGATMPLARKMLII